MIKTYKYRCDWCAIKYWLYAPKDPPVCDICGRDMTPITNDILYPEEIKERHAVPGLPEPDKNKVRVKEDWSSIKTVGFGMMGAKSYEKIYVLKEIKDENGRRDAIVEMNAIPTAEAAEVYALAASDQHAERR